MRRLSLALVLLGCALVSHASPHYGRSGPIVSAAGGSPTVRGVGTLQSSTAAVTLNLPSGTASGDLLVAFCKTQNQAITITDWTALGTQLQGDLLSVFYRVYTTGENLTTSDSGLENTCLVLGIQTGTYNGSSLFSDTEVGNSQSSNTTSLSATQMTTSVDNSLVVLGTIQPLPDASGTDVEFSGWSNANFTPTERADYTVATSNGGAIAIVTGQMVTAGATGAITATTATSASKAHFTFAVTP